MENSMPNTSQMNEMTGNRNRVMMIFTFVLGILSMHV